MKKLPVLSLLEATRIACQDLQQSNSKSNYFITTVALEESPPSENYMKYVASYSLIEASLESFIPISRGLEIGMNGSVTDNYLLTVCLPRAAEVKPSLPIIKALEYAISEVTKRQIYQEEGYFPWLVGYMPATATQRDPY